MENKEIQINWVDLLYYLKKKALVIVAICLVCAVIGSLYTILFMETEYTASTRIYVLNRTSENYVSYSDYYSSDYMIKDYQVLITGQNVTKQVVEKLNLNMSPSALAKRILVSSVRETRVLQIQVVDTNPRRAADIANCVREVAGQQLKDILNVESVNLIYEAEVPKSKSGPNAWANALMLTVLGLVAGICLLTATFFMDDTIRTEEDVEHYLGLSVLGVIPASDDMAMMAAQTPENLKSSTHKARQKLSWMKKA